MSDDIKNLLDIQDEYIYFEKNSTENKEFKGKTSKFITGTLTYHSSCCENYGIKNENYTVYKNGTKTSRITLPIAGIYPTYLNLKKQRFFYKACNSNFIAKTSIVEENCFISDNTKTKAFIKSAEAQSLKDIANDCYASPITVKRIIYQQGSKSI